MGNSTCPTTTISADSPPLIHNGVVTIQAHQVGWLLCGIFAIISTTASFWLINKHLVNYTNPSRQRYIVRLLFMVPIYSIVTLLAYIFYSHASPFLILRDGYEGVVVYSFFYLMLEYVSPNDIERRNVFRRKACFEPTHHWKWMFPLGWVKYRPESGLYFLQLMKWGVLQYCVITPSAAIMSVILEAANLYCEDSWSPAWAHVWLVTLDSISITIAMYCLLQLYFIIAEDIAPHRPLLQLLSIKAIVFLTFWQSVLLDGLSMIGLIKDGRYMTADEINVGIAALLQNFEMIIFAFLHIKAFDYKPYRIKPLPALPKSDDMSFHADPKPPPEVHTSRLKSLRHAFSFTETWHEIRTGTVYLWNTMRGREAEPHSRFYHFEAVMGTERPVPAVEDTISRRLGTLPAPASDAKRLHRSRVPARPRALSWDDALDPYFPLATIDEELDAAPPASLLRFPLEDPIRTRATLASNSRYPPTSLSSPSLVMPSPLSPARYPRFQPTDFRIAPSHQTTQITERHDVRYYDI